MDEKKKIPTGVKVIAILYYISVGLFGIFGLLFLMGAGIIATLIPFLGAFSTIFGIVFLAFGVLAFFIGRGLWKAKNWARILVIILSALGLLGVIIQIIISGNFLNWIIAFVTNAIIGGYLLLSKEVKKAFE